MMREEETLTWSAGGDGDDGEALAGQPCFLSSVPSSTFLCLRPLIFLCPPLSLLVAFFPPAFLVFFFTNSSSVLHGFSSSVHRFFFVFSASQFSLVCVLPFSSVFPVLFPVRSPSVRPLSSVCVHVFLLWLCFLFSLSPPLLFFLCVLGFPSLFLQWFSVQFLGFALFCLWFSGLSFSNLPLVLAFGSWLSFFFSLLCFFEKKQRNASLLFFFFFSSSVPPLCVLCSLAL